MTGEFDPLHFGGPECDAMAPLLVRAAVETLSAGDGAALGDHLSRCDRCRREAMETGDFVAGLRRLDQSVGGPSRRFSERVRARIAVERALRPTPQKADGAAATPRARSAAASVPSIVDHARPRSARGRRAPRAGRLALWLGAMLLVSLGLNFWWVSRSISGETREASPVGAASLALASPSQLGERLARLRAAQDPAGLIAGDAGTTAWWLIAESRAKHAGYNDPALAPRAIFLAQQALLASPGENARARTVAALGLVESADWLGFTADESILKAVAGLLGIADGAAPPKLAEARSAALAKLASIEAAPAPAPRFDGNDRARLQVNSRSSDGPWQVRRANGPSLGPIAAGDARAMVASLSPDVAFDRVHPASLRAEALCAAASASILLQTP